MTKIVNRCKGHKLVFASVIDTVLFSFHEINIYILQGLYYYYMVFVVLSQCSSLPHFPRHFFFHKKCLEKSVRCIRTIPDTFNISIQKLPGKKISFHPHFPRHFQNVHKKCLAKKCSLNPHVPRHILYFHKKVPGKKFIYFRTSPGT